jgi:hypothetical protein
LEWDKPTRIFDSGVGASFAAGTPVHTDHGSVPIEQIKVGDKVWAHKEKSGANELRTVTAVAPQHRDKLLELHIEGEKNPLRATPAHPFYTRRNAGDPAHWINAGMGATKRFTLCGLRPMKLTGRAWLVKRGAVQSN